jgi:hypothetical protein
MTAILDGHHPLSSQCFGTDMINKIYLLLKFTVTKSDNYYLK